MKFWHENKKVGIDISRSLGNTNTNTDLSNYIVAASVDWDVVRESDTFLEPAVGAGSFYFALADNLLSRGFSEEVVFGKQLIACDVDSNAISTFKTKLLQRYGKSVFDLAEPNIYVLDFLSSDIGIVNKFNWVVTNPPYVSARNIPAPAGMSREEWLNECQGKLSHVLPPRSDLYMWFFVRCLEALKDDGQCIFLCSDSWIDSDFGSVLKSMILDDCWSLEELVNSQLLPFFRDDTNAILTKIKKNPSIRKSKTEIFNLRLVDWDSFSSVQPITLSHDQLDFVLRGADFPNRRNALFLFNSEYNKIEDWFHQYRDKFSLVGDMFDIKTSSVGASAFPKDKIGMAQRGKNPVFWQLQARVNRPPNYKTHIPVEELTLWVADQELFQKGKQVPVVNEGIYMSTIVDRYPLFFYTDHPTVHVNKYFSIVPKSSVMTNAECAALFQSVFSILSVEQRTKEGTRKTLRKGECGLAKEVSKTDMLRTLVPKNVDFAAVAESISKYQSRVIFNLEDAYMDDDYVAVQKHVAEQIGALDVLPELMKMLMYLYILRMRHIVKLSNFEEWYQKNHGKRLEKLLK